jgi:hypothetical protein
MNKKIFLLLTAFSFLAISCGYVPEQVAPPQGNSNNSDRSANVNDSPNPDTSSPQPVNSTSESNQASGDQAYTNKELGFQLTFPASWTGYKVTGQSMSSNFGSASATFSLTTKEKITGSTTGNNFELLTIVVYQPESWAKIAANDGPKPVFLAKSSNWVYAYTRANDAIPSDLKAANSDFSKVISSFKLVK